MAKDRPVWASLSHEADNQIHNGTYTVAIQLTARRRSAQLVLAHPHANVRRALILMGIGQIDNHVWQD